MQNYGLNLFFGTLWFVMTVGILNPEIVGEWQARRDIAVNATLSQYYNDNGITLSDE